MKGKQRQPWQPQNMVPAPNQEKGGKKAKVKSAHEPSGPLLPELISVSVS